MFEKYGDKYLTEKLNKKETNLADLLADDVSDYLGDTMDFDEFSSMDQGEKEDVVNNALGKLSDKYYNDGDFDKDLDKLMNRKYKEVTSYIASQLSEGIEIIDEARGAKSTEFTKPGKDGDIYFSKREGNAVGVRQGDLLQMIYVYDGEVKLGKVQKTDKRWENMGEPTEKLLIDLKLKNVGGLNTKATQTEDGKLIYAFLSESVNEAKDEDYLKTLANSDYFAKGYETLFGLQSSIKRILGDREISPDESDVLDAINWLKDGLGNGDPRKTSLGKKLLKMKWVTESEVNEAKDPVYKKGDKVLIQLTFKGGVGKFADSMSKSKNTEEARIVKRIKNKITGGYKYELSNYITVHPSEIVGLAESVNERLDFNKVFKSAKRKGLLLHYYGNTLPAKQIKKFLNANENQILIIDPNDIDTNKDLLAIYEYLEKNFVQTNSVDLGDHDLFFDSNLMVCNYIEYGLNTYAVTDNSKLNESLNEAKTYRLYMNSDPDAPNEIDYERYFGDGTKAAMIKSAKKLAKDGTNQYGDPIKITVTAEDDIDDVAWTNESVNEGKLKKGQTVKYIVPGTMDMKTGKITGFESSRDEDFAIIDKKYISLSNISESVNEGKFKYNPDSDEVRDLFVKMFPGKSGYDDLDSNMFIDDENKEAWVLNVDDTPISPKDKAKFVDAVMKLGKKKGWKIKQYGNDAIEIYESVNEASDPLTLPNSSIVSIKGNVITTQAGKKYKILTTKPNLKKKDLYVDMDFMKSSGDPTDGYVAKIDPNDSYGMSTAGLKKVVSVNEASDIRKEYDSLKKASVSFLRSEWSRNQKVGNPKELDKAGLISDLLRWKFGNKKVAAEFGLDESWMLPRFENFVNENENRVYGMFTDDQGKPGKLDKELLDIALKGLPAKITKNIDAVEANGYGGESHISPPTVSNKGQSRGEIEYKMIHIGLLKPMGKNKIMGISLGLRKRTSGPGTGYLYMKVVPDWRHTLGPDAEGAIEFWEDPASFLQKLYNEKFKNWF